MVSICRKPRPTSIRAQQHLPQHALNAPVRELSFTGIPVFGCTDANAHSKSAFQTASTGKPFALFTILNPQPGDVTHGGSSVESTAAICLSRHAHVSRSLQNFPHIICQEMSACCLMQRADRLRPPLRKQPQLQVCIYSVIPAHVCNVQFLCEFGCRLLWGDRALPASPFQSELHLPVHALKQSVSGLRVQGSMSLHAATRP